MLNSSKKKPDDKYVDLTRKSMAIIKSEKLVLDEFNTACKAYQKALEATAAAQKQMADALLSFEGKKNKFCADDVFDCFAEQGSFFLRTSEKTVSRSRALEELKTELQKVASEQDTMVKNYEKSWRQTINQLTKNVNVAEARSRREAKKAKTLDKSKPSSAMQACVVAVEKLDEAKRGKLKELLLVERRRMCGILDVSNRIINYHLESYRNGKTMLKDPLKKWESTSNTPEILPELGRKQVEAAEATYVPIDHRNSFSTDAQTEEFEKEDWADEPEEMECLFQVVALYDCEGQANDELSFKEGEIINVTEETDEEWYFGELSDGTQGVFPVNYTQRIQ